MNNARPGVNPKFERRFVRGYGTRGMRHSLSAKPWRKPMDGDNRTPDKIIGEVKYAKDQTERTTGHKPPDGPGAPQEEAVRANPDRDPAKKKTGEF
jgi:hypothetical protein